LLLVGIGYVGLILPVMPGTIFFILALNCFRKSDARLEHWLLTRPYIGPVLRQWDEHGAIQPRTKRIIVSVLWLSVIGSIASAFRNLVLMQAVAASSAVVLCAVGVTWYVLSRPDGANCQRSTR
jgi:uncharacterized membrane protein YbaN (DUF454 family)